MERPEYGIPTTDKNKPFPLYAGAVLAPKSMIPLIVTTKDGKIRLNSPDGKISVAGGYFGDKEIVEGGWECVRQHMLPGLRTKDDLGRGFGAAAYIGGLLAAMASGTSSECTWSTEDNRSNLASFLWSSLKRHDLALEGAGEGTRDESFEVLIPVRLDPDDYIDVGEVIDSSDVEEAVQDDLGGDVVDVSIDGAHFRGYLEDDVHVEGTAKIGGAPVDFLPWENVRDSELVLDAVDENGDELDFTPPPPDVLGRAWWGDSPADFIVRIFNRCANLSDMDRSEYLAIAVKNLDLSGDQMYGLAKELDVAEKILPREELRVKVGDILPKALLKNPRKRRRRPRLSSEGRAWMSEFGPSTDWG